MANDIQKLAELRKRIFITGYKGKMAHLASCFSSLEILYVLYQKGIMKFDASNPDWQERDRLILSKGHAGLALFALMQEAGFLSKEEYESYLQEGSHIGGEPCMRDLKGVEATTGSLGHGLSMATGIALGLKSDGVDSRVYTILGDGELEEGTVWEAAISAPAFKLDNMVAILDCNEIQKMDSVENTIGLVNWNEKWKAFGWDVVEVDGHDIDELVRVLSLPKAEGKPRMIIAHTVKGKGVSIMENNPIWHFKLPNKKELKVFKAELGITDEEL